MKDFEKQIEDSAKKDYPHNGSDFSWVIDDRRECFVEGAKSNAAKEFHQQGMYSEQEAKILIQKFNKEQCASTWFDDDEEWFNKNKRK